MGLAKKSGMLYGGATELGTYATHNDSLWLSPLDNEASDHHVVARLHKAASANVAQD